MNTLGHNLIWYKGEHAPRNIAFYAECSCSQRDDAGYPDAGWAGSVSDVVDSYAEHVEEVLV